VTCHLTCPVTDFINKNLTGESFFEPVRFSGWPELKEAYLANYTAATFILAPMAMALREQGVPIKIIYLGHRDGSAVMVHRESGIFRTQDLKGKTVAVPGRYANQRLILHRELKKAGLTLGDINIVELSPSDMPAALPQILIGIRIALGVAGVVVVAAEMIAVNSGLGYLIIDAHNAGKRYDLVVAGMVMIGLLVRQLERFDEVRWGYGQR